MDTTCADDATKLQGNPNNSKYLKSGQILKNTDLNTVSKFFANSAPNL